MKPKALKKEEEVNLVILDRFFAFKNHNTRTLNENEDIQ